MNLSSLASASTSSSPVMLLLLSIIIASLLQGVLCYECYVCSDQAHNSEKCIKTVLPCKSSEKSCMSVVRWGGTPYWDPNGRKQYYVSKQCATSALCEEMKQNNSRRCDRIWYNDWQCVECCHGDRCNYFVTLGAGEIKPTNLLTAMLSLFAIAIAFVNFRYN